MTFIQIYTSTSFHNFCKAVGGDNADEMMSKVSLAFYEMPKEKQLEFESKPWLERWCRVVAYRHFIEVIRKEKKEIPKLDNESSTDTRPEIIRYKLELDKKSQKRMFHAIVFERSTMLGLGEYSRKTGINYNTLKQIRYEYKTYIREWIKEKLQS